jgi:hypothetical protein
LSLASDMSKDCDSRFCSFFFFTFKCSFILL